MIIVDANIWVDHLRGHHEPVLDELVLSHEAAMHPHVLGEIALGSFANRDAVLTRLQRLPVPYVAREGHVRYMIDEHQLYSTGIGYSDAHLIASARLSPDGYLWTRDKRLHAQADRLGVAFKMGPLA
ncbi:MAG: type II toxin-antitoxin system VapC family toxin [Sphingomonadaceae bacterium]|nr:type II toxin-antitoxin system VapC family toxin [Sphingomonadaceae bacterium]